MSAEYLAEKALDALTNSWDGENVAALAEAVVHATLAVAEQIAGLRAEQRTATLVALRSLGHIGLDHPDRGAVDALIGEYVINAIQSEGNQS